MKHSEGAKRNGKEVENKERTQQRAPTKENGPSKL